MQMEALRRKIIWNMQAMVEENYKNGSLKQAECERVHWV
jgi:hypothetical protein